MALPVEAALRSTPFPSRSADPTLEVKKIVYDTEIAPGPAGEMKFIYGSILTKTGDTRVGWMAYDALTPSAGCP